MLAEEWIYKDKGVKVGYGSYKNKCDREKFYCAGGKLFGGCLRRSKCGMQLLEFLEALLGVKPGVTKTSSHHPFICAWVKN